MIHVEWVDDPQRWTELRGGWDALVERSAHPSVYATWDFLDSCRLHFAPPGSAPRLAVLRSGDEIVGFAPLLIRASRLYGLKIRQLSLLAAWEADRAPLILPRGLERDCLRALFAAIESRALEWDYFQINELDPESASVAAIREWVAGARGLRLVETRPSPSPFINLDGDVDAWLSGLGASTRKSFRRYQRQLEALGRCELEVFDAPDVMERALELYIELEGRSWKQKAGQGVGKDQRNLGFYRELLPRLAAQRRAAVLFLTLDGRRIAANIELWLGPTGYCPHTTFDPEFARYSPGNILQVMALRWHVARGIKDYGLFGRFLENKARFTNDFRANVNLRVQQMRGLRRLALFAPNVASALLRGGKQPAAPPPPPSPGAEDS